ncbi:histone-like nucleoid-structuring protein Lsr2 [Corynebacterium glyciniphilum]|uniref:histone-like nucleoid-structuring protein Lsr2 n=1 Tax=Corynebacterium glyciniphilum TaxID=1404244 RepID=UPI003FD561F9
MARKEVVQYTDDITGEPLDADKVSTVELSYGGKDYVLDLSHESSLKLATVLDPWVTAARKVTRGGSHKGASQADKARNKAIREWAKENGYEVSARGQIAKDVIEAYDNR